MKVVEWSERYEGFCWFYAMDAYKWNFFRNTPLDSVKTDNYEAERMYDLSKSKDCVSLAVVNDLDDVICSGMIYPVSFLSIYFYKRIGVIDALAFSEDSPEAVGLLIAGLMGQAKRDKYDFLSVTLPSDSLNFIRALEQIGFYYAEGFTNMVGKCDGQLLPEVPEVDSDVRCLEESDFDALESAYFSSSFPSRYITDLFFNPIEAKCLYVDNFKRVWREVLGEVWVAELNGKFAGALIGMTDKDLKKDTGIKTNARSGMGIIVDPSARGQGVASKLLAVRDRWYFEQGIEWQVLGANLSNVPMLRLLEKLGFYCGNVNVTLHWRR